MQLTLRQPIVAMEALVGRLLVEDVPSRPQLKRSMEQQLLNEALLRLRQMRRLIYWIIELYDDYENMLRPRLGTPEVAENADAVISNFEEGQLHTESFYYVAHRFMTILKVVGFTSCKCPAIRDVRHNLIEHSENVSMGTVFQAFAWGDDETGPRLKPFRAIDGRPVIPLCQRSCRLLRSA